MSKRRDGSGIKQERLQKMHKMLQGAGDVSLKRFMAICSYNIGLNEETTMRYLRNLADLDLVEVDETADVVREVVKGEP